MITNYFTLRYVASSLAEILPGSTIRAAFSQEPGVLVIDCAVQEGALITPCLPRASTLYLHRGQTRARRNTATVLRDIHGLVISSVSIHPSDRIISFHLSGGFCMHALCFGSRPNVIVVDSAGTIHDAFRNSKSLRGSPYTLPPEPDDVVDAGLVERALSDHSAPSLLEAFRRKLPSWGAILVRELLVRAGIDPMIPPGTVGAGVPPRLRSALLSILRDLAAPSPLLYTDGAASPALLSLIPLTHLSPAVPRPFADIHEAIRVVIGRRHSVKSLEEEKRSLIAMLQQALERAARSIAAVEEELRRGRRREHYERYAAVVMAHLAEIEPASVSFTVEDAGTQVTVPLDPGLSAAANAQRYFDKAKAARSAEQASAARLEQLRAHHARGTMLLEQLEGSESIEALRSVRAAFAAELSRFGLPRVGAGTRPFPFRVFRVDGGFEVWAGKSGPGNDLLTLRHAKPADLWFHARGGSGAHVILRVGSAKGAPGKRAREETASIAAFYSALKHSRIVPVAVTERKYVRKPKGAAPGAVLLEREQVIFAQPRLPHEPLSEP